MGGGSLVRVKNDRIVVVLLVINASKYIIIIKDIPMKNKILFVILTIFSCDILAEELTKTFACDTCGYAEAVNIAEQNHLQPNCTADGLDNGNILLGETTFTCPVTSVTLIVANPLTRESYKFEVRTEQQFNWAPAYNIIVENSPLTPEEDNALHMFYDIDDDFRQAMEQDVSTQFDADVFFYSELQPQAYTSSANDGPDCSAHPVNVLSEDPRYLQSLETQFSQTITGQMGLRSWKDFTSDISPTGGGLSIGNSGLGIAISFEYRQQEYFLTKRWSNGDKLVFNVKYNGDTKNIARKGRSRQVSERFLNLNFKLQTGSSKIDGLSIDLLVRQRNNLANMPISVCVSKQLDELLDEVAVIDGHNGAGSLIESLGPDATNGGTLIPPSGSWLNLSGCRLIRGEGRICRDGKDDCIDVEANYISCK